MEANFENEKQDTSQKIRDWHQFDYRNKILRAGLRSLLDLYVYIRNCNL